MRIPCRIPMLRSANPYLDFARAIEIFHPAPKFTMEIHPTAVIAPTAKIAPGAHIGPYCFVEDGVEIGRNAVLHSFVTIYRGAKIGDDFFAHSHVTVREDCRIGHRVLLQNGVTVGSDGYGFARNADGGWHKMRQSGITVIEDDVEIQAHSVIDRATVGETRIGRGTKIDNLVQVGHACKVGDDTMLCGQVGLGRHYESRRPLHSCGASGNRRPPHHRRPRGTDRAVRSSLRRARRYRLLGVSRDGNFGLAQIGRGLQPPTRNAKTDS